MQSLQALPQSIPSYSRPQAQALPNLQDEESWQREGPKGPEAGTQRKQSGPIRTGSGGQARLRVGSLCSGGQSHNEQRASRYVGWVPHAVGSRREQVAQVRKGTCIEREQTWRPR